MTRGDSCVTFTTNPDSFATIHVSPQRQNVARHMWLFIIF